jgi:hypothetical protein
VAKHERRPATRLLRLRAASSYQPGELRLQDDGAVADVAQRVRERAGAMSLPKISASITATELRNRVVRQLAMLNGHAPKEKAK